MEQLIKELRIYASGLSALYVEDNAATREEVYHILRKFFNSVDTASDGKDGLEKYTKYRHDVVISDIKMPVMDGIELSREIKKINKDSVIVITSAHDDKNSLLDLINIGIDKFIMKPLDNMKFMETLLYICKNMASKNEIQRHKTNTEAIFRSVSEAIITVDTEMKIIAANDAAKKFCGTGCTSITGRVFNTVFGRFSARFYAAIEETLKQGVPARMNRIECDKTVVSITVTPLININKEQYGAVIVIRDDTYASALEIELNRRGQYAKLVGKSEQMQRVYSLIESLADTTAAALITGESGTGKELAAEAIHYGGEQADKPLIKVNCGALPEGLLESELFGHVKGAFTGAVANKEGRFQKAHTGTIFLDEIGDIPPSAQIRLLRVLQDLKFERVGSSTPIKVDVRVIAATNRDLKELVNAGKFREDLYYRLKVVQLHMPPLRERMDDIHLLVRHFIEKFNLRNKKDIEDVSSDVMKIFLSHPWPGNVRELEHTIEHAFVMCNRQLITVDSLPEDFNAGIRRDAPNDTHSERDRIIHALEQSQWSKTKAAASLGISRVSLYDKLKKYKIV